MGRRRETKVRVRRLQRACKLDSWNDRKIKADNIDEKRDGIQRTQSSTTVRCPQMLFEATIFFFFLMPQMSKVHSKMAKLSSLEWCIYQSSYGFSV